MNEEFYWLNEDSTKFLERGYLPEGVSAKDRIKQITDRAEEISGVKDFSDKLYNYVSKGWVSFSTPVWCNYGLDRGLPISCFSATYQDDTADILRGASETGMLTKMGGGTAGYFGNLRARGEDISGGGKTNGSVAFIEIFDTLMNIISQGSQRRGAYAAYLPVDHGDIEEFLTIRNDESPVQNISLGVVIPEGWMQSMIDGDKAKRKIWAKVLKKRSETGYPYLYFKDNVNSQKPNVYKDKDMDLTVSNLCSEIMEYVDDEKSFTCCLSSINLLHYDDWKDTDLVETMTLFLDTVLTEFIKKASNIPFLEKAVKFAREHRSIGLGVLGLHSYLQSKIIPFEGLETKMLLNKIFSNINEKSLSESKRLAILLGEPKILEGYGERFTTRLSIAPTTSSSFILGQVSPSIEPLNSNYFIKDVAKGKFVYKNPYLKKLLEEKKKDTSDVWKSILLKGGSIQHLPFLSKKEKDVFKTFGEISQLEIIQNASIIQKYIDQGISLNTMIHPDTPVKDINMLIIEAWKLGIKTLYYQRSANMAQELSRNLAECKSCEA